jgi:hypothetical protein
MMSSDELYLKRNALLNRATSFRAKTKSGKLDKKATIRERSRCYLEAEAITRELEELWAARSKAPEPKANLYECKNGEWLPTHALQESDGITYRYVPLERWVLSEIRIDYLSPVEKLRKQELTITKQEIEYHQAIERLYIGHAP